MNDKECPACGAHENSPFRPGLTDMFRCRACGLVWTDNPDSGTPVYEAGREKDIYVGGKAALFRRCLKALAERFPSRGKILDVGSAYGGFMGIAKAGGWNVEGVEIDPKMSTSALSADFKVYSRPLEEIGLPAVSYDVVTVFEVLCLMTGPVVAIKEIYRVLKPGGVVYIREFNGSFHMALEGRWIFKVLGLRPSVVHNFNFTAESLWRMLTSAGFRNIKIKNSRPTSGDPYGTGGCFGAAFTGLAKFTYYCLAQAIYYASFGTVMAGSSFIIEAEK